MPRPRSSGEPTRLGAEMRRRRSDRSLHDLAAELGVTHTTLSRAERGEGRPRHDTAKAIARWLGWSVGHVFDAAEERVDGSE